ncbi:MAG: DNA polymerase I [Patescibacteria group bacterium]
MKSNTKQKFIIIDGNAIIHRAYHALPPLTTKDGTMVNAVYGFTSMLLKVITDLKPDYLAVSFDVGGGTFRDKMYEEYKANRVKADEELYTQIPLVYEIVKAFDIPIYTKEGFEADDVIATVIDKNEKKSENIKNIIVSGDKDLLQLVSEKTNVYLLKKGLSEYILCDIEEVKNLFGFEPQNMIDYKALRGDPSDNIPGIKGIGDKTAKDLITKIGKINNILEQSTDEKSDLQKKFSKSVVQKIKDGQESAKLSAKLATVKKDVPDINLKLADCQIKTIDLEKITDLLKKFEFFSLIKRLPGYTEVEKKENKKSKKMEIITENDFENFLKKIAKEKSFVCKEILNGTDSNFSELESLLFVIGEQSWLIKNPTDKIFQIFSEPQKTLIGHDLKTLIKPLIKKGIVIKNSLFDTMIASYILNSSTKAHDIKSIAWREFNSELKENNNQSSLFGVEPEYLKEEMEIAWQIYPIYKKKLEEMENFGLFEKIEMNLIPVLADMELNGVKIDIDFLKKLSEETAQKIRELTKKIWQEAGEEFNIASSVQLRDILFEKMDLPTYGIKKGKTGYSTAASELEKLQKVHPIINMIENYRELDKLRNTYIDVLPTLINKKSGRIHTTFNQAVTTTGRLSSSDPNIQNIPIRSEEGKKIRESFISEKGHKLIVADYSQIELRIVASLAEDKKMLEIFDNDQDIHKATAAKIHKIKMEEVTKEMRSAAKAINFGVLYGMGSYGLAQRTGLANYEAQNFIDKYFTAFSDVKKYLDNTLAEAKKNGFVETLFGRRRYIPELKSKNKQIKNSGERMAINMPVQGTAADIMKMAMINIFERLKKENLTDKAKILIQVHDEIVIESEEQIAEKVATIIKEEMENVIKLRVKIKAEVGIGVSWGKIK